MSHPTPRALHLRRLKPQPEDEGAGDESAAGFVVSIFYLVRLPGLGRRTKDLPYAKTFHNALAMCFIPAAVAWADAAITLAALTIARAIEL